MPMILSDVGDKIGRTTGTHPAGNADFSFAFWLRPIDFIPTAGLIRTIYILRDTAGTNYVGIFQDDTGDIYLKALNGTDIEIRYTADGINAFNEDYYVTVTFAAATNTFNFYINGVLVGTDVLDIGTTFNDEFTGDDTAVPGTFSNFAISFFRQWEAELTLAEILLEMDSDTVVKTADLFLNLPFIFNYIDLAATRNWSRMAGTPIFEVLGQPSNLSYTTNPLFCEPSAAAGISVTPNAGSLVNSVWAEIIASTPEEWALASIAVSAGINPGQFRIMIGIGAAASEVEIANITGFLGSQLGVPDEQTPNCNLQIPIPVIVPTGSRLSWRLAKVGTDVTDWEIKLNYYKTPVTGSNRILPVTVNAAEMLASISLTPNTGDFAYSAWHEYVAATDAQTLITALAVSVGANVSSFEIDIGTGLAGEEIVLTTIKSDSFNTTALAIGGFYQFLIRPFYSVPAGTRIVIRMRKSGTSSAAWGARLTTYEDVITPDYTTNERIQWFPSTSSLTSLGSSAAIWTDTAWVQFSAGLVDESVCVAILPRHDVTAAEYEIDIGYGEDGEEIVATTFRIAGGAITSTGGRYINAQVASKVIPGGQKIKARARIAATTQTVSIAIGLIELPDFHNYGAYQGTIPPVLVL